MDKDSDHKGDPEMEYENSPVSSSNMSYDPETPYGRRNSPSYVKWDFDLPPVSENIKEQAKALGQELKKHCSGQKHKKQMKLYPYFNKLKSSEEKLLKNTSYSESVKLLKEAIRHGNKKEVEKPIESNSSSGNAYNAPKSPDMFDDDSSEKCGPSKANPISDVFDDSFNEFIQECTQPIEAGNSNPFLTPPRDKETSRRLREEYYAKSGVTETPKTVKRRSIAKDISYTPRNLTIELEAEDDDLFLEIDM